MKYGKRGMLAAISKRVEAEGAEVLGFEQRGTGHYAVRVRLKDGREVELTTAGSPTSADISARNVAQDVRRYHRGVYQ